MGTMAHRKNVAVHPSIAVRFGRRVRERRQARGLTQVQVAARIGMTVPKLSQLENGRGGTRGPTLARLQQVAEALGVPLSKLLA